MIWWDRLFPTSGLRGALQQALGDLEAAQDERDSVLRSLEAERTKRLAYEALAVERKLEVERLVGQLDAARAELSQVFSERLKSLDALNSRLMESRTEGPPPDLARFQRQDAAIGAAGQIVRETRAAERALTMAIIAKMHPEAPKIMNIANPGKPSDLLSEGA